jgi:UDP-N-acetylmuramoyl-tripeptide--D-alanyl-D-alanine ligase
LIDDTYNANPDSTEAAIKLVERIKTFERKILFLGDMLELGQKSIRLHQLLEKTIRKSGIDAVYTIGPMMKYLHKELIKRKISAKHFRNRKQLVEQIKKMEIANTVVLVKGSRGMKMEEFVSQIKMKTMN